MSRLSGIIAVAALAAGQSDLAFAQSHPNRFQLSVQVASAVSSQFDQSDLGVGGRFSWHPVDLVGIESEIDVYPADFPDRSPISRGRVEGLFGATVGPRLDRVRPFVRLRAGFLSMRQAPQSYACILIFPPPISCELMPGRTLAAFDVGGGIEMLLTRTTFIRIDAGDRLLRYPGPVTDNKGRHRAGAFISHDFRLAVGAGLWF